MEPTTPFSPASLWPLFATSIAFALLAFCLARNKGRRTLPWTLVALVPLINMFCVAFLIGASNLRVERKLDTLLGLLDARGANVTNGTAPTLTTGLPATATTTSAAQWSDTGPGPD